jgi:hypothetical protein
MLGIAFVTTLSHGQSNPCTISDWKPALYPPLAKAAHISDAVVTLVQFDHDGKPTNIKFISGHRILRDAAAKSIMTMVAKPFTGVRECPVVFTFVIGDCDKRTWPSRTDSLTMQICAENVVLDTHQLY